MRGALPFADPLEAANSSAKIERTVHVGLKRVTPSARIAGYESTQSTLVCRKSELYPEFPQLCRLQTNQSHLTPPWLDALILTASCADAMRAAHIIRRGKSDIQRNQRAACRPKTYKTCHRY